MIALIDILARSLWTTILATIGIAAAAVLAGWSLDLTIAGATGLYFVTWWITLFAVLPVGMRSQAEAGEITTGTEPGAPAAPALRQRAIWTSLASAIVFIAAAVALPLTGL
ncbi:DUF1467 family protein [Enterovirga sp.]|jgi:predicted secreted protein|uniref:DUF1467 family protein n=1 Tax=Enterovirga sp. TaxID=2026350 RepID=UPI002602DCD3|nr:DUF1467 family protein [Enterovirga sp.]MDB5590938.1 hypothetical protein [Enterovirga sp.]